MPQLQWTPLSTLRATFDRNVEALSTVDAGLAESCRSVLPTLESHGVCVVDGALRFGRVDESTGESRVTLATTEMSPERAREFAAKLCPTGKCTDALMVAGLDLGWLWQTLYQMPCEVECAPGHTPPLWLVSPSIERFVIALHVQHWPALLTDSRVQLFVGPDAFERLEARLLEQSDLSAPAMTVTVGSHVWPDGLDNQTLLDRVSRHRQRRLVDALRRLDTLYAGRGPATLLERLHSPEPLRVLGCVSRYTTYLQYAMNDWLAAFDRAGHTVERMIESADHLLPTNVTIAERIARFRPDVIVMIDDHRRGRECFPANVPVVCWIQDRLPRLFNARAGAEQGENDFAISFARQECVLDHDWPADRHLSSMLGFDPNRFEHRKPSRQELDNFGCDVSYVSHASRTAEAALKTELDRAPCASTRSFLETLHGRMRAVYDAGDMISDARQLDRIIDDTCRETSLTPADREQLLQFAMFGLNNAMYRHQTLQWLADAGVDLRLWGRGWDAHPALSKFAQGVACNEGQLASICRASRINLQASPTGSAHQRVFDGLAAGGFFLLRHTHGDEAGPLYRSIWNWSQEEELDDGPELFRRATPVIRKMVRRLTELTNQDPTPLADRFYFGLQDLASTGFASVASTLWDDDYDAVSFESAATLRRRLLRYLNDGDARAEISRRMLERVIDRFSYDSINRRLLGAMRSDLRRRVEQGSSLAA